MTDRAEFERWWTSRVLTRTAGIHKEHCWQAWQAARSRQAAEPAQAAPDICGNGFHECKHCGTPWGGKAAALPKTKTDAEIRQDAKHDTSCVGAFARARPRRVPPGTTYFDPPVERVREKK
jgi:hypothetical protein